MNANSKANAPLATPQDTLRELQEKEKELNKFIDNLQSTNKTKEKSGAEYHLNRLLNESYVNPYDILEVTPE